MTKIAIDKAVLEQVLEAWQTSIYGQPSHQKAMVLAMTALRQALEQSAQELEFITHNVEQPYDWSEWVCPDPKSYLMKCCDCGLVHEAEFKVVRYKSETECEDCEPVDDPNLQAVFRMRRSEQWSPVDMAHRAGWLSMVEQPAHQEPMALRLADELDALQPRNRITEVQAAYELRRLHAENQQLIELSLEEAKINGAGAERELKLMTDLENKQAELLRIKAHAEMQRMDDEALLRQALEALEAKGDAWVVLERKAIAAIKERLK